MKKTSRPRFSHYIIWMGNNSLVKEDETMRVEYQKTQLFYGDYRPGRVIWITLLNGLKVLKFNLLDQAEYSIQS